MKTCKFPYCKTQIPSNRQFCDKCNKIKKSLQNKRWRSNNPDYNKEYLRRWKRELREKIISIKKEFYKNPIPFLLKKAVAGSEYLESIRAN